MDFSFDTALNELGRDAAFTIANEARPDSAYLLNSILPERNHTDYFVERGKMIVRSTMASVVAMDAPYPMGGYIQTDTFSEKTFKVGIDVALPEAALRTLQYQLQRMQAVNASTTETLVNEALNFYNKVVLQAHFDMSEWLRGQALTKGELNFSFNGKAIAVDYGVPDDNKFDTRTTGSNEAYGGTSTKFWDDVREARRILKGGVVTVLMNSVTADEIIYNPDNDIRVVSEGTGFYKVQRLVKENGIVRPSEDTRDFLNFVVYDLEGDLANPATGGIENVKFIEDGYVVFVGRNHVRGYEVGQGSTVDPWNDTELGYTHIAPTVEGGGQPGRWGRLFTPQERPWELRAQAVANLMPVILNPEKLVIAHTEIA